MLHIMVLLKFLGSYRNAAAFQKIGHMMGISKGSVNDYAMSACNAILKHHDQIIRKVYGFVNCIGVIDGKLFLLAFAPMVNGEDFYTRKGDYAIKGLVICDDAARITWIEVGWLGSVHDNQVWSNSEIYMGRDKYLLGDSAFSTSAVMIPAFKKGPNSNLQAKGCKVKKKKRKQLTIDSTLTTPNNADNREGKSLYQLWIALMTMGFIRPKL